MLRFFQLTPSHAKFFAPMLLFSILIFSSCGSKQHEKSMVAPQGMSVLNLQKYGKPFSMLIPDSLKNRLSVSEESSGALEIRVGDNFAIAINEQAVDLELAKSDIAGDEVNRFKHYLVEEPFALVWESEIVGPEFHFYLNRKIGNSEYSVQDIKDPEHKPFSKEQIEKMVECARSIVPNDQPEL